MSQQQHEAEVLAEEYETMNFYKQVAQIQNELKAPKGQFNKFGGYAYRSCEDILEAVKKVKGDLIVFINDEIQLVGDRVYVKATATITDGSNSISNTAYAREPAVKKGMDEAQITGATSSYARKYALNGLFCIDDTKDADTQPPEASQDDKKISKQTAATLRDLIQKTGSNQDQFCAFFHVEEVEQLAQSQAAKAKAMLESKLKN